MTMFSLNEVHDDDLMWSGSINILYALMSNRYGFLIESSGDIINVIEHLTKC